MPFKCAKNSVGQRRQSLGNLNLSRMMFWVTYNVNAFAKAGNLMLVQPRLTDVESRNNC